MDQTPSPIQLPPQQTPHPSEAAKVSYEDPNAPKPKKKLHVGRVALFAVLALFVLGGGLITYIKLIKNNIEPSSVSDYSGGIADPNVAQSQVTEETEVAKKFLQAVQSNDSATVQSLAADSLKQQAVQEKSDTNADVLSLYQGKFDSINFDNLISSVSNTANKTSVKVVFSDKAATEGSTGTYRTEVIVVTENGERKIESVNTGLSF